MNIACVAVVGKQNEPLFISTYVDEAIRENGLRFHYYTHSALDVVEEKLNTGVGGTGVGRELYLGLLFVVDTYKCYGYVTNTKIKFLITFADTSLLGDDVLKQFFGDLHDLYVNTVCNPFSNMDCPLEVPSFRRNIDELVDRYQCKSSSSSVRSAVSSPSSLP